MYRIVFKPGIGAWVIQLDAFFLFWHTVAKDGKWRMFPNYDMAKDCVKTLGLENVYQPWQDSYMARIGRGQYAN